MKNRNIRKWALPVFWKLALLGLTVFLSGCSHGTDRPVLSSEADLVICTDLEAEVYEPVVKEFEERTGFSVEVLAGTAKEVRERFFQTEEGGKVSHGMDQPADWDLAFGVSTELLDEHKTLWLPCESREQGALDSRYGSLDHSWTGFSVLPLVIMYNTNVVTYRELPTGWDSLLEPRWQGRVAFADPEQSDVSASALAAATVSAQDGADYTEKLVENLAGVVLESLEQVNEGILDGRYCVGVTTEAAAQTLRSNGADVDYIYPEEGTEIVLDGTAIRSGSMHEETARAFLDFTVSRDVQKIMALSQNRRPVRIDAAAEKSMDPMEKLPLLKTEQTIFSEKKQQAVTLWRQLTGKEGDA